ncbi:putative transcription factor MYB family [Rosa chinensis]|uniref:Putative transcription factor MYB family n=1 Tax=Rosa chinensis TaxID=74649 RepID=A0A2P6PS08_ROSCH|nr:trihelix transcription factor DF1 [Rosa chinensis]PRQ24720.1 putative transcription factor MYB family [Rosa chinensis]
MLGDLGSSSDATTATAMAAEPLGAHEGGGGDGGVGSNSGEEEKNNYSRSGGGGGGVGEEFGDRSFGGNRWPRQETLALLKIRSDMDVAFRDASVKGPLWEEVSRKLAELGFHRSAKKCKEKFENVYKYHRRTKEGRTGKSDGKTYRFFDQLQALENQPQTPTTPNSTTTHQPRPQPTIAMAVSNPPPIPTISHINSTSTNSTNTVPSAAPHQGIATPTIPSSLFPPTNPTIFPPPPQPPPQQNPTSHHQHHQATTFVPPSSLPSISSTDLMSNSTSSSTSSDEEMEGRAKRKRKWKDFFETLMKEVVRKQEDLQKRFLEAIEKREQERMAREEAWRLQELARINREREILAQERSIAAAKDTAVMSFLQKIAEQQPQHNPQATPTNPNNHLLTSQTPQPQRPPAQQSVALPPSQRQQTTPPPTLQISQAPITTFEITPRANGENNNNNSNNNLVSPTTTPSSSRWPKVEVHSLIKLRRSLDSKYQENGPKGPLWEEISGEMKKLGYNRSAKRCKEKWENINKYFKKVKESNKKRPEDSKTCPYFHLLDSLYRERNIGNNNDNNNNSPKPENAAPLMVRPEQQWQPPNRVEPEMESERMDQNHEEEDRDGDEDEDEDEEEDEGNYEIVANKGASVSVSVGATTAQ